MFMAALRPTFTLDRSGIAVDRAALFLRGATLAFLAYALLAIHFTCEGSGSRSRAGLSPVEALLHLQEFLLVLGVTALLMGRILRERAGLLRATTDAERRFSAFVARQRQRRIRSQSGGTHNSLDG